MITRIKGQISGMRLETFLLGIYFALIPIENVFVANIGGSVNRYIGIVISIIIILKYLMSGKIYIGNYKAVFAFFGYALISGIWSIGADNSYITILINMVVCTLIFIQVPLHKREANFINFCIVLSGIILSLILISGGSATEINTISSGRMTLVLGGLVIDNNNLAVSLSICALVAFSFFYEEMPKLYRILGLVCFLTITVAIFLTGSRGGLLAEIGGLIFYLLKSGKGVRIRTIIIGIVLFFTFTYILQNILSSSLTQRFTLEAVINSGGTGRTTIWKNAIYTYNHSGLFRQIFGYGYGTFGKVQQLHWGRLVASHNDFIGTLIELGIIGEMLFITVWIMLIHKSVKDRNWLALSLLVVTLIGSLSLEMVVKKMLWMTWYFVLVPQIEKKNIIDDYHTEYY